MSLPTRSELVRRFTLESAAKPEDIPRQPKEMNPVQVAFITKMAISELIELVACTPGTHNSAHELRGFVQKCFDQAFAEHLAKPGVKIPDVSPDPLERLSEQADALGDVAYYVENAAIKAGIDLEPVFREIHTANERKRFADGTYHRNAEGKVIKPPDWTGPNVTKVILEQLKGEIHL